MTEFKNRLKDFKKTKWGWIVHHKVIVSLIILAVFIMYHHIVEWLIFGMERMFND